MNLPTRIVADIGGTHARFALLDEANTPRRVQVLAVADFAGPVEAMQAYLAASASPAPSAAAIAIAAPVHEGVVALTNASWSFSRDSIRSRLGLQRLLLLNDFSALALSLPHLPAAELRPVGSGIPVAGAAKAVLGPGTGLGVSGLLHHAGHWLPRAAKAAIARWPRQTSARRRSWRWPGASTRMSLPRDSFPAAACRCSTAWSRRWTGGRMCP